MSLRFVCTFEHPSAPFDLIQLLVEAHLEGALQPSNQQSLPIYLALELAPQPSVEVIKLLSGGDLVARSASVRDGGTLLHLYCHRRVSDNSVLTFLCDALPAAAVTESDDNRLSAL